MMQSRTHTCGELRLANAGEKVKIVGWMENLREVGGSLGFAVLRDFYGTTQIVVETEDMMRAFKAINKESTISVEGVVRERASKNPKLPTGEIEVVLRRQHHSFAVNAHTSSGNIYYEAVIDILCTLGCIPSFTHDLDPGHQFLWRERFGYIIIYAQIKREELIVFFLSG